MIIPSSTHGVIASSRPRVVVAGGGGDVTPNAVNWDDIFYDNETSEWFYTERQITGINETITIKVQYTAIFGSDFYYYVSNSSGSIIPGGGGYDGIPPASFDMNTISNNGTFTVSNNQYVTFGANVGCGENITVTIKNQSDGDSVLDTLGMQQIGEC